MNKISNNILAFLSGLGLILFPQTALAEEESNSNSDEGSAAGSAASGSAVGELVQAQSPQSLQ